MRIINYIGDFINRIGDGIKLGQSLIKFSQEQKIQKQADIVQENIDGWSRGRFGTAHFDGYGDQDIPRVSIVFLATSCVVRTPDDQNAKVGVRIFDRSHLNAEQGGWATVEDTMPSESLIAEVFNTVRERYPDLHFALEAMTHPGYQRQQAQRLEAS